MTSDNKANTLSTRNGACDLLRFIFSLLIMGHHLYHIGLVGFPFSSAWIYVEFFYMVSGFYIASHYEKKPLPFSTAHSAKEALAYTIKRYKNIFLCYLICLLVQYLLVTIVCVVSTGSLSQAITILIDFPLELLLISPLAGVRWLVPVWYLSAMFIVMPMISFLYTRFRNIFVYIISWLIPAISYILMSGVWSSSTGWEAILRAFCYISFGCFLYHVSTHINKIICKTSQKVLLTIIEVGCFVTTIVLTGLNSGHISFIILLLSVGIAIMMSGVSYTAKLKGRFFTYIGKLSLPVFLSHWAVGTFIGFLDNLLNTMNYSLSTAPKLLIYYFLTLVASALLCKITDIAKNKKAR